MARKTKAQQRLEKFGKEIKKIEKECESHLMFGIAIDKNGKDAVTYYAMEREDSISFFEGMLEMDEEFFSRITEAAKNICLRKILSE